VWTRKLTWLLKIEPLTKRATTGTGCESQVVRDILELLFTLFTEIASCSSMACWICVPTFFIVRVRATNATLIVKIRFPICDASVVYLSMRSFQRFVGEPEVNGRKSCLVKNQEVSNVHRFSASSYATFAAIIDLVI
jgi:hypothetical protein